MKRVELASGRKVEVHAAWVGFTADGLDAGLLTLARCMARRRRDARLLWGPLPVVVVSAPPDGAVAKYAVMARLESLGMSGGSDGSALVVIVLAEEFPESVVGVLQAAVATLDWELLAEDYLLGL